MYFPGPEQDLYLNLISPWGTIPEYKSQYHSKRGEYRQIPILQGCPFRIAYAVTSYISQDSTPYNDIPFYLCFQVVINGKKVGEPVIINQRNKEECSGYLTGLPEGVSGGEVEWSKFYQPLWQQGTTNAKGKDIKPFDVAVYVYRCSASRKKGGEGTKMPSGYCKTLHNEPQGSFVRFDEERCVFGAEKLHGNGEPVVQYEWETTVLNPRSTLLGNYKWYCHDPSIATYKLKTITTSKAEHDLPLYSKGSKTSFVHKIGPPLKRDWDSNHTSMVRFKERMKAQKLSPLRSSFLPDAEEEDISGVILSGPTQKLPDNAQITPLTSPDLDIGSGNLWKIGISRTGQVKYYTKSTPNNSSKAKATARLGRHEWPYMHKYMTRGWEKRYINRKPYFFDHNTGCTQRKDPRLIKNTIVPVDPCPNIVPLQTIREDLDYYITSQLMVTGLIDTPSCSIYRQDSQVLQETFIVDYKNMESLLSLWNVYTSKPAQQDSSAVDALYSRTTDSPTTSSPTEDSPTTGSPTEDSPTADSLTVDSLAVDPLTADSPTKHSPTTDSLTMDTPTVDSPAMDPPTKDSPAVDPLAVDSSTKHSPTTDSLTMNSPTADPPTVDSPAVDSQTKDSLTVDSLTVDSVDVDPLTADSLTTDPLTADSLATDSLAVNSLTADSPAMGASTFVESSKYFAPINQLINKTLEAMGRIQTPAENSIKDLLNTLRRPQVKKGEKRETTSSDEGDKKRIGKRKRTPSDEGDKTGMGGKKRKSDDKEDKKGGVKRERTFSDDEDQKGGVKRKRTSIDKEDQQGETRKRRASITKEDQKGETKKKGISIDNEDQKEETKKRGTSIGKKDQKGETKKKGTSIDKENQKEEAKKGGASSNEDRKGGVKRKRSSSDEEDQKGEVKRKRASVMRNTKKEERKVREPLVKKIKMRGKNEESL